MTAEPRGHFPYHEYDHPTDHTHEDTAGPGGMREGELAMALRSVIRLIRPIRLSLDVEQAGDQSEVAIAAVEDIIAALTPEATAPDRTADPGGLREAIAFTVHSLRSRNRLLVTPEDERVAVDAIVAEYPALTPEATAPDRTADPGGLRKALVRAQSDAQSYYERLQDGTTGKSYHHGRMVAYMDAIEAHDAAALTPEATAPGLCVERGGPEPCTHHAGSGPDR